MPPAPKPFAPDEELVRVARALAHPVRLALVRLLADRQRRLSGDITAALRPLPRTTVSQHLVALRKSGLVRAQADGLTVSYWLNPEVAPTALRHLAYFCVALLPCPVCGQGAECACFVDGIQRRFKG